mgnify:CR=1 FL=1
MKQIAVSKKSEVEEGLVRHLVLNSLRLFKSKFSSEYGDLVICCDDRKYWRRDFFPYYKANRKKDRAASDLDWHMIFDTLNTVKQELKDNFKWKVIQVEGAEADDIIGTLCHKYGHLGIVNGTAEPILILSSDKDFCQLQKYANVEQYSPIQKQFVRVNNPERYTKEHILKGDRGDGIPNFLSPDDTFINNQRQRPLKNVKLQEWAIQAPEDFCSEKMMRGYKRNQTLVDLDFIPNELQDNIIKEFEEYEIPNGDLLNYFIKNKLKNLMEHINEF